jgi:type IV pilus assembly protein PilX
MNSAFVLKSWRARHAGQSGVSLVLVMIFLVILSILGITAMQSSTLSSRIARNESDRNVAFQAAESALRDAENDILSQQSDGVTACNPALCRDWTLAIEDRTSTCDNGICDGPATSAPWETASIWGSSGKSVVYGAYTSAVALPFVSLQPRYITEIFKNNSTGKIIYRVTAVGFGANDSTQIMLQTTVRTK